MDRAYVFEQVVAILKPFVKNPSALATVGDETAILGDLKVNSARVVELIIRLQQKFAIDVSDEEADRVHTIGDAVNLVLRPRQQA
jgi:acyl carrier protein